MTERQAKKLYWPAWGRAFRRNWATEKGRLSRLSDATASEWLDAVATAAERLAQQQHRAVVADDLRHGCHVVALGRDVSSKDLKNAQLDRVVTLFALLEDPDNLDAVMAWQNPALGEAKRLDWVITHAAPEAYIRAVAGDKFGTRMWEWLDVGQKRALALTLRNRKAAWNRPVECGARNAERGIEPKEYDVANAPW